MLVRLSYVLLRFNGQYAELEVLLFVAPLFFLPNLSSNAAPTEAEAAYCDQNDVHGERNNEKNGEIPLSLAAKDFEPGGWTAQKELRRTPRPAERGWHGQWRNRWVCFYSDLVKTS